MWTPLVGSTDEIHLSSFPRQVPFISVSTAHRPTTDTRPIPPAFPCCPFAASGPQAEKCSCSAACPCIMETLNKARLTALYAICRKIWRRILRTSFMAVFPLWFHISVPFGRSLTAHFCGVLHPAKNPFTIYTIEHPEMLHFPEKIFEVCIHAQFCNYQIVKDAQILFSGRDLQKKIPFCIDLCYNKKKHRRKRQHDRQHCAKFVHKMHCRFSGAAKHR